MKGTDRIDKNGEGLFVLLDVPLWCIDKVKRIFKHVVMKYSPSDVVGFSIIIPLCILLFVIGLVYQIKFILVVGVVCFTVTGLVFGVHAWHDFIVRKQAEYKHE